MTKPRIDPTQPISGLVVSAAAIRETELIAKSLGYEFDADGVRNTAKELHQIYFQEISNCLGNKIPNLLFNSGAYRITGAFAATNLDGNAVVALDYMLDVWVGRLTELTVIAACKKLDYQDSMDLLRLFSSCLKLPNDIYAHVETRHLLRKFHTQHSDVMFRMAHPMSRAILAFIICHEIAHCALDHLRLPAAPEIELEADRRAAEYFKELISAGDLLQRTYIAPQVAGAPLLLFRFMEMVERERSRLTGSQPDRSTHPSPMARFEVVSLSLQSTMTERARFVLDGLLASLDELGGYLEFGPPVGATKIEDHRS